MKDLAKLAPAMIVIAMAVFSLSNCKKELLQPVTKSSANNPVPPAPNGGMVITPFGLMPKANVYEIEPGYHIDISTGHVLKIHDATSKVMADFGEIRPPATTNGLNPLTKNLNKHIGELTLAEGIGTAQWQTYAQWYNTANQPITSFSTTWNVPTAPTSNDNQVIYIWNGLLSSAQNEILQPMLQWGNNTAFGGNYWVVSNWFAWPGPNGTIKAAYTTPSSSLTPGTSLTGTITFTGSNNGPYTYTVAFNNYTSSMNVTSGNIYHSLDHPGYNDTIPVLYGTFPWAVEALEAYHLVGSTVVPYVVQSSDYPPDLDVAMKSISLTVNNSPVTPGWAPETGIDATLGEHTILNGSSEVDLYFRQPAPVISYTSPVGYTVNTAISALTPTNTGGTAVSYSVSPALPAGLTLNTTTGVISGTPTAVIQPATNYVVTATNYAGSSNATINMEIWPAPSLFVNLSSTEGVVTCNITPNIPSPSYVVINWKDSTANTHGSTTGPPITQNVGPFTKYHTIKFWFTVNGSGTPSSAVSNTASVYIAW